MVIGRRRKGDERDFGFSTEELASMGLTPTTLAAAIQRAKLRAQRLPSRPLPSSEEPSPRARLASDPNLDRWFQS
ncbi:MAG: hypothetical protein AAGA56_25865 [Myxococcota bacterium]